MVSKFEGPGDRERLAALGDVDAREREAVEEAKQRREEADAEDNVITVTEGDLEAIVDQGSVVVFTGTDSHDRVVTFAVDHRPARDIVALVQQEGELACQVEDWQVLRRTAPVTV